MFLLSRYYVPCSVFSKTDEIHQSKCCAVPCCTCSKLMVIIMYNVSIHLLFVLPSGWSGGSDREDGRPYTPPDPALGRAGTLPSDPSAPGDQEYTQLASCYNFEL